VDNLYSDYENLMSTYESYAAAWEEQHLAHMKKNPPHLWIMKGGLKPISTLYRRDNLLTQDQSIRQIVGNLGDKLGVQKPAVIFPTAYEDSDNEDTQNVLVSLSNISRINTENLSWQQITEVRKDGESFKKLNYFRNWASDNLKGKTNSEVLSALQVAEESFKSACGKHGIDTRLGNLHEMLDDKFLMGTGFAAAVLISAAMGIDTTEFYKNLLDSAATGGIALFLAQSAGKAGQICVSAKRRKIAREGLHEIHPIVYLLDIDNRAGGHTTNTPEAVLPI